jgi:hypothetical protein
MPSPIKYSSSTANSRTRPKKTLKTKAHKTQPKIGGSPKTPTKRVPLTVSKSSTLKKPKTKTHKTQPKKPYGHSRLFGGVNSLSMPSVNTYGPVKSTSAPVLSRSVQPFSSHGRMRSTSAPVNSTLQRLQQNGCLTLHKIDNELIVYLGTLDTSKIKKLIFDETKIQDEKTFKAFLFILKRFQNVEEIEIFRFWTKQNEQKTKNTYFIDLIKNIRYLPNVKILAFKTTDFEDEILDNHKDFAIAFLETVSKLKELNLKHLIFDRNSLSPDTISNIYSGFLMKEDDGTRKNLLGIAKFRDKITIKDTNYIKMEQGH